MIRDQSIQYVCKSVVAELEQDKLRRERRYSTVPSCMHMHDDGKNDTAQTLGIPGWMIWLIVMFSLLFQASCSRQKNIYTTPSLAGSDVVVDVTALKPKVPQFFTYEYAGKSISFFVIKIDDNILSFFDACVTCYPHKRGYGYEDEVVICKACNQRFSVFTLEKGIGGCYPIKIAGRMKDGKYMIPVTAIEAGAKWF